NLGLTKSLNILINKSKGIFIARQDSDDISSKTRLEKQLDFMEKQNLDACTTRAINKQTRKKVPGLSYYLPYKLSTKFKNPFIHGTLMIKSDVLKGLMYDEEFYYSQDFVLFLNLIKNFNIKTMNNCLYELNTKNNISENFKKEQKKYFDLAKKRNI
ncbi:MAG: glycosyltransferase, partial [Flavobacteriaceae bacterium]